MLTTHIEARREAVFRFTGILANVDHTILGVQAGRDLTMGSMPVEEVLDRLAGPCTRDIILEALGEMRCVAKGTDSCFVVTRDGSVPVGEGADGRGECMKAFRSLTQDHLDPLFRKMRLFKRGDPCMPLRGFSWSLPGVSAHPYFQRAGPERVTGDLFTIEPTELPELTTFMASFDLAGLAPPVDRAVRFFEASYHHSHRLISVSLLLDSMASLLATPRGATPLSGLPRDLGVLLGSDREKARNVQRDLTAIMATRDSDLSGTGPSRLTPLDVVKCRAYARACIREFIGSGLSPEALRDALARSGHGDRPWRKR